MKNFFSAIKPKSLLQQRQKSSFGIGAKYFCVAVENANNEEQRESSHDVLDHNNDNESYKELEKFVCRFSEPHAARYYKDRDFDKEIKPALDKFKDLNINAFKIQRHFRKQPKSLIISKDNGLNNNIIDLSNFLSARLGLETYDMHKSIWRGLELFNFSNEQLEERFAFAKETFKIDETRLREIMIEYPNGLLKHESTYKDIYDAFKLNLDLDENWVNDKVSQYPFILDINLSNIRQLTVLLHEYEFTFEDVKQLVLFLFFYKKRQKLILRC